MARGRFLALPLVILDVLSAPVTKKDIRTTLFDMKPLKAPGVDGLHATSFQCYWDVMGD